MSRARQHSNLAARMGRWSAAHWKTATFGWLALVVVAFAVGSQVGTKQVDPNTAGPGESGRMDRILDAGFKLPADESVLIQSGSVRAGAPAFDSAVADVVVRFAVVHVVNPRTERLYQEIVVDNWPPVLKCFAPSVRTMPTTVRVSSAPPALCRVVGKHCESGDVLVRDLWLPADVVPGDLLAVAATGAYCWSMASNYNYLLKPPVVAVRDGAATEVVRRQTLSDVFALDAVLADVPAPVVAPSQPAVGVS